MADTLIPTTHGDIAESRLTKQVHAVNGGQCIEYYLGEELVHRSVVTHLSGVDATAVAQEIK